MDWLRKLLGARKRNLYEGDGFSVRIERGVRECVGVIHTRQRVSLTLGGELIGKNWQGLSLIIPEEVEASRAVEVTRDLRTAFEAMGRGYVIARKLGTDIVPEAERQSAIAELKEMGYEIKVMPDGAIHQTHTPSAPRADMETIRKRIPWQMALLRTASGKRPRIEILARSKKFEGPDYGSFL